MQLYYRPIRLRQQLLNSQIKTRIVWPGLFSDYFPYRVASGFVSRMAFQSRPIPAGLDRKTPMLSRLLPRKKMPQVKRTAAVAP